MDIIKISPQGFCKGVTKAIYLANKALEDPAVRKPIYMLGSIVHNRNVVKAFQNKGMIILEGKPRIDLLDDISEGTVIFTAHGVSDAVRNKAIKKGLGIIDATCRDVENTHSIIKSRIADGYTVLFYGKANHPETEGVLGISDKILLVNEDTDILSLPKLDGRVLLTNQTTMSYPDVLAFYQRLLSKYPQLEILEEVCSATRRRQTAVIENEDQADCMIIVGDPSSNNTKMLKEVAESKAGVKTFMVENIEGLKGIDLSVYRRIGITAGASTPDSIVEEIISNLKSENPEFVSKLKDEDYLK